MPRPSLTPEHWFQRMKLFFGSLSVTDGNVGGIDDDRALLLEHGDRLLHRLLLIVVQPAAPCGCRPSTALAARRLSPLDRSNARSIGGERDAVVEECPRDADARALEAGAVEELRVVAPGRRRAQAGRRIVRIRRRAFERAEHDRDVAHRLRHRPGGVLVRGDRNHAVAADAADRRLDGGQHVLVGRAQDRPRRFRADVAGPEIRGGANPRARAAGGQRGAAVEGRLARILPRVVRVIALSADRVVVARHRRRRTGHPVGELRHAGLRDDDCAGSLQVRRQRRLVGRYQLVECERAAGRPHVGRVDVVLQGDRNAVQRTADFPLRPLPVALGGDRQRLGIHGNRRVQKVLVGPETGQILLHQLPRCHATLLHRRPHLGNGRFDDREGRARRRRGDAFGLRGHGERGDSNRRHRHQHQ